MPALNMRPVQSNRSERTPLEQIPDDVKDTLEEALREAPGERLETYHGTATAEAPVKTEAEKAKAEEWLVHARSYAQLRPEGKLTFAGNPVAGGYARWTVSPR